MSKKTGRERRIQAEIERNRWSGEWRHKESEIEWDRHLDRVCLSDRNTKTETDIQCTDRDIGRETESVGRGKGRHTDRKRDKMSQTLRQRVCVREKQRNGKGRHKERQRVGERDKERDTHTHTLTQKFWRRITTYSKKRKAHRYEKVWRC